MEKHEKEMLRDLYAEATTAVKSREYFVRRDLTTTIPGDVVKLMYRYIDEDGAGFDGLFYTVKSDSRESPIDLEDVVLVDSEGRNVHIMGNLINVGELMDVEIPDFPITDRYGYPLVSKDGPQKYIFPSVFESLPLVLLIEDEQYEDGYYNEIIPAGFTIGVDRQ